MNIIMILFKVRRLEVKRFPKCLQTYFTGTTSTGLSRSSPNCRIIDTGMLALLFLPLGWDQPIPPFKPLHCRLLWLPEEEMDHTFLLCWPSSLEQRNGLPLPPFQEHCPMLKLRLWEAGSGWLGVIVEVPTDLRWPIKSDVAIETLTIVIMSLEIKVVMLNLYYIDTMTLSQNHCWWWSLLFSPGAWVPPSTMEPMGHRWKSSRCKTLPCRPLCWTSAAALLVIRWKFWQIRLWPIWSWLWVIILIISSSWHKLYHSLTHQ